MEEIVFTTDPITFLQTFRSFQRMSLYFKTVQVPATAGSFVIMAYSYFVDRTHIVRVYLEHIFL